MKCGIIKIGAVK